MLCLAVTVSVEQSLALAAELENTVFSPSQQGLTTAEPQTGSLGTLKKAAVEIPGIFRLGDHGIEINHRW
jgi:hypothetical protein